MFQQKHIHENPEKIVFFDVYIRGASNFNAGSLSQAYLKIILFHFNFRIHMFILHAERFGNVHISCTRL